MLLIYKKAVESRIFNTPVGWEYLKTLQKELNERNDLKEEVPPVALYTVFAHRVGDYFPADLPSVYFWHHHIKNHQRNIFLSKKNIQIDLSYKEFELLAYFMENKGLALSREKILNSVWNYDYFGDARTIDTHVLFYYPYILRRGMCC